MTWLHVAFRCHDHPATLARQQLETLDATARQRAPDAVRYLEYLTQQTGTTGGLSLWSATDASTEPRAFVDALLPSFGSLLQAGGPLVVLYQHVAGGAGCYQIFRDPADRFDDEETDPAAARADETFPGWGVNRVYHYRNLAFGAMSAEGG